MFFIDYSLLPLLVQQNYIDVIRNRKGDSLQDKITRMGKGGREGGREGRGTGMVFSHRTRAETDN